MSEKKRKRESVNSELSAKKYTTENGNNIHVTHFPRFTNSDIVIASSPGLSLPKDVRFQTYSKVNANSQNSQAAPELLLYSSYHPIINYTARERQDSGAESLLAHYVGIFDPEINQLSIIEARKMNLKGSVRSEDEEMQYLREKDEEISNTRSLRQKLASEFGTKKAKKAINALAENAITASGKFDTQAGAREAVRANPAAAAVLDAMAISAENVPDKETAQAAMNESKPRPYVNPDAKTPEQVYPLLTLIGADAIPLLDIKEWVEKGQKDEAILTPFKFISRRLGPVVKSAAETKDMAKVRALKYMFHLMRFNASTIPMKTGGNKVKPREQLEKLTGIKSNLLDIILRRFAEKGNMTKWHVDNLMTHIAALSLWIDDFETDTYHLKEDLRLKPTVLSQYFLEIGVRLTMPTESQRAKMGIHRADKAAHKIGKLKLPLEFPKTRVIPLNGRR